MSASTVNRRPRVALATSADWPDLAPDDRGLAPALGRLGIDSEITVWTDPAVDWRGFDLVLVRSCWDYHDDLARWLGWIDRLDQLAREHGSPHLCNPPAVLRWNSRKTYLAELEALGTRTVPTVWLEGETLSSTEAVRAALMAAPFAELVCKPAVSAGALGTLRLDRATLEGDEARAAIDAAFPEWVNRAPLLVQPFVPAIAVEGEWSLLFFDGDLSHAVLKRPAPGDFRVQERHGGSTSVPKVPARVRGRARSVLAAAAHVFAAGETSGSPLTYARVDMVVVDGNPLLMELELIEPALFLEHAPVRNGRPLATERLAGAIARQLGRPSFFFY